MLIGQAKLFRANVYFETALQRVLYKNLIAGKLAREPGSRLP
jgi:hypothetical protein